MKTKEKWACDQVRIVFDNTMSLVKLPEQLAVKLFDAFHDEHPEAAETLSESRLKLEVYEWLRDHFNELAWDCAINERERDIQERNIKANAADEAARQAQNDLQIAIATRLGVEKSEV